jgi:hypothetical protein
MLAFPCSHSNAADSPVEKPANQVYALLIGIGDYGDVPQLTALMGPVNDVTLMKQVLQSRFGVPGDHITVVPEDKATHSALQAAFAQLAQRIGKDDFVYVHYSGHGSHTNDPRDPQGIDQTWIPYGARRGKLPGQDDHDIKDKEISAWLRPIYAKTSNLVFVSDSCDSGSITRGGTPTGVREGPPDARPQPPDTSPVELPGQTPGIKIGATEDWDYAYEFDPQTKGDCASKARCDGVFTWFWSRALMEAQPGQSWYSVYSRAYALITEQPSALQKPQFTGSTQQAIFSGQFKFSQHLDTVTAVNAATHRVTLDAGTALGVTRGSTYTRSLAGAAAATIVIDTVAPFSSQGVASGAPIQVGDLVAESKHVFDSAAIRLAVTGDFPSGVDRPFIDEIGASLRDLPGFALAAQPGGADVVLHLLRPHCAPCTTSEGAALPTSFQESPPEVWITNRGGRLLGSQQRFPLASTDKTFTALRRRLAGYARAVAFDTIDSPPLNVKSGIAVKAWQLRPNAACKTGCYFLPGDTAGKSPYDRIGVVALPASSIDAHIGDALTFTVEMTQPDPWYVYIVDVDRSAGVVQLIFPSANDNDGAAKIDPAHGKVRDLSHEYSFRLTGAGIDVIKVIATQDPLSVKAIERGGDPEAAPTPLTQLSSLLAESAVSRGGTDPVWMSLRTEIHTAPAAAK